MREWFDGLNLSLNRGGDALHVGMSSEDR